MTQERDARWIVSLASSWAIKTVLRPSRMICCRGATEWELSENVYDWLGNGIYFWEFAPHRALTWGNKGGVIGAVIQLGVCLDLTDVNFTTLLELEYRKVQFLFSQRGQRMPENTGGRRDLDCLIVNELVANMQKEKTVTFQSVRCPFLEGEPAFPGSGILKESHVQIAVRDKECLLGLFRPNLS